MRKVPVSRASQPALNNNGGRNLNVFISIATNTVPHWHVYSQFSDMFRSPTIP